MKFKLPKGWKKYTVEELIQLNYIKAPMDGNHGSIHPKSKDYVGEGIPFIMAKDLKNGKIDYNDSKYISEETSNGLRKGFSKSGDVLITHKATMGRTAIVDDIHDYIVLTPQVTYYRTIKKINNVFLKYYFDSNYFQNTMKNWASSGSSRAYLGILAQRKLPIILPSLQEQKAIADTLSALDDKIELNNKINENLEKQAQAIFKHWFVDFEFPDENGNPYKSSGGEMIESELGMIPKGWEVEKIKEISKEVVLGKTPKTADKDNFGGEIPFLTIPDMHNKVYVEDTARTLSEKGASTQVNKTVPKNSICVSCIATPGLVTITKEPTQTNQQISTIIPKIQYTYVYSYMKLISNKIISLGSGGTTTKNLNKTQFSNIDIIVPLKKHLEEYHNIMEVSLDLININQQQNQKLTQIRDTLLPKLMSGEVRIPLD